MFQLFSSNNKYVYRPESLKFEKAKVAKGKILAKKMLIALLINVMAIGYIFIYTNIFEPPANIIRSKKVDYYSELFKTSNLKIEELYQKYKETNITSDKVYREVLNLDSIPSSIRNAGFGGSEVSSGHFITTEHFSESISALNQFFARLRVQSNSYDTILKEALLFDKKLDCIPGIPPVKPDYKTYISSYFGSRTDPFTHMHRRHKGLDFVGPLNCEIYATANGTVTLAKQSRRGYGNEIVVDHGFGYATRYAHLNKILVTKGQKVKRGQLIGLMGSTGRSTGTHLHYEVRLNNIALNPIYFYEDDLSAKEYELITKRE